MEEFSCLTSFISHFLVWKSRKVARLPGELLKMEEEPKQTRQLDTNDQEPYHLRQSKIENKENPILQQEQLIDKIKDARLDNEGESNSENGSAEVGKVGATKEKLAGKLLEMEEETKHSSQLEVNDQEVNNPSQTTVENKENPILEQEQVIDKIKEAGLDNEGESNDEKRRAEVGKVAETEKKQGEMLDNEGESKVDNQHAKVGKEEEKEKKGILKKPKAVSKQKYLNTPTIPQPFSLAADKRMVREKHGGTLQTTESKSKLQKSISLNLKVDTQNLNGTKQSPELRRGVSVTSRSTLAKSNTIERRTENGTKLKEKARAKGIESKTTQVNSKNGEEIKLNMLKKSTAFKASPLPSFYHRKDPPPKPELKKAPVTRPKSPQLGLRNKSLAEGKNINKEDINTSASRTISITAKETIHKLLKGAWKAPTLYRKRC